MVLAIPLTIKLARQQQILFSHAAETKVEFLTKEYGGTTYNKPDGSIASCVTTRNSKLVTLCQSVKVRFTAPTGADLRFQSSGGQGGAGGPAGARTTLLPQIGLVSKAYADNCEVGDYCDGTTLIHKSGCVPDPEDPDSCTCNYPGDANSPTCGGGSGGGGGGGGCTPSCSGDRCGQGDGCGGSCPNDDANTAGKCGNSSGGGGVTCGNEYAKDLGGGRAQNVKDCSDGTQPTNGGIYCIDSSQHIVGDHCESGGGGVQSCDGYNQVFEDGTTHYCTPGELGSDGQCHYDGNGDGAGPTNTNCDKIVGCPSGQTVVGNECKTNVGKACIYSQGSTCYNGNCLDGSQNCIDNVNCGYVQEVSSGTPVACPGGTTGGGGGTTGGTGACNPAGDVDPNNPSWKFIPGNKPGRLTCDPGNPGTMGQKWQCGTAEPKFVNDIADPACGGTLAGSICKDNPVNPPSAPAGSNGTYIWKADCNKSCTEATKDTDCPQNTTQSQVDPATSNWCFTFSPGLRCMQLKWEASTAQCPAASTVVCGRTISPTSGTSTCEGKGTKCTTGTCNGTTCVTDGGGGNRACTCPAVSTVTCGQAIAPSNAPCNTSCSGTGTKCTVSGQTCGSNGTCSALGGTKFKCGTNGLCTQDATGTVYADKATCDAACADPDTKKKCYICDSTKPAGQQRRQWTSNLYTASECAGVNGGVGNPSYDSSQSICETSPSPSPLPVTIVNYRFAEVLTDLTNAQIKPYLEDGTYETITFASATTEEKFMWVQFQDNQLRWTEPKNGKIFFAGQDPVITGAACDLDIKDNSLLFALWGTNFGNRDFSNSHLAADNNNLEIKEWLNFTVVGKLANPSDASTGRTYQVSLTRVDGVKTTATCSVNTTQISLGAKLFCRAPSNFDQDNVKLTIIQNALIATSSATPSAAFQAGSKARETVTITKEGIIQNLKTKLQTGLEYIICIKAPKSLRICSNKFAAVSGNNIIANFNLPVGDVNDDDAINSVDASICKSEWGPAKGGVTKACEFNKDNVTNSFEWSCVLHDINRSSQAEP